MKRTNTLFALPALLGAPACADEPSMVAEKGLVDRGKLADGVEVVLIEDDVGVFEVPFAEPVPDIPPLSFATEMEEAASLQVLHVQSKTSTWLTSVLVGDRPKANGEYMWILHDDGTAADFVFYNGSPTGTAVDVQGKFRVYLQIFPNEYVGRFSELGFDAIVREG